MVIWCDMVCLALALAPSCAALHFWCLYIMLSKSYLPRRCDWKDGFFINPHMSKMHQIHSGTAQINIICFPCMVSHAGVRIESTLEVKEPLAGSTPTLTLARLFQMKNVLLDFGWRHHDWIMFVDRCLESHHDDGWPKILLLTGHLPNLLQSLLQLAWCNQHSEHHVIMSHDGIHGTIRIFYLTWNGWSFWDQCR